MQSWKCVTAASQSALPTEGGTDLYSAFPHPHHTLDHLTLRLCPRRSFATQLQSVAGQAASTVHGATQQIDLNSTQKSLSQGFATLSQNVRERTGQTQQDDVTELPQGELTLRRHTVRLARSPAL